MKLLTKTCLLLSATIALPSAAETTVKVQHAGTDNTMVRVHDAKGYLMLPIQESNDEAKVNVIVDNKTDRTINVRLARNKVDYSVPFDLSPYEGKDIVFNIITTQNRSSVREAKSDAAWSNLKIVDSLDLGNREKHRPLFHHTPRWGWMNDPNGMFYKDGKWHLYYQWNPFGSKWQNLSWGHSVSEDLINWEHLPIAVEPDGLGMIFSGSSAIDKNNTAGFGENAIVSMWTSCDNTQQQSLGWSNDGGLTFNKYEGNPTIVQETEARDPNFFFNTKTGKWNLLLAHALDHEMQIFSSDDMKTWTLESTFGKGLGCQEGVWECPDLFELPIGNTGKTKWMLICNINPGAPFGGSGVQYFIGDFDGKTFTADTDAEGNVPTKWLDYGKDNYALVSFSDVPGGRRTAIGWMSNWQYAPEVPTKQYRSANTLPRDIALFEGNDGQIYASAAPSIEIYALRGKVVSQSKSASATKKGTSFRLPTSNDGACEITATLRPSRKETISLTLSNTLGEKVIMTYNPVDNTFEFDRKHSGITDFSQDFPVNSTAPTFANGGEINVRIFVDRSSIEVFGNNGKFSMTNIVFPNEPYNTLTVSSPDGKGKALNLKVYDINIGK